MRAIITVDLGFGDAGKGATVDALVRKHNSDLVVRYNGGCQAAHHVQLPDGRRHCFSQFGSGALAGARTYLGPHVIINPHLMRREADSLTEKFGINPYAGLTVHPNCLVATSLHMQFNRLMDAIHQHGTCGLGIGATRKYWLDHGDDAITVGDLTSELSLRRKISLLKERLLAAARQFHQGGGRCYPAERLQEASPALEARCLRGEWSNAMTRDGVVVSPYLLDVGGMIIFEGAQGVLLDQTIGFHPHTTWSDTTAFEAKEILEANDLSHWDTEVLGIIRAYQTRHGNGPMPTESRSDVIKANFANGNDDPNSFAGKMRAGPLDMQLLKYAVGVVQPDSLAVTCVDQLDPQNILYGEEYIVPDRLVSYYSWCNLGQSPRPSVFGQRALTDTLNEVTVSYRQCQSTDELLGKIDKVCPVSCVADGPTYTDRTWK